MTFDLDLWATDLTINRGHLLIKDYLPTKFKASRAKRSWVISCTRLRDTDIPTARHVQRNMPLLLRRGHKYRCLWNTNAPLPQIIKNRLDLSPTDLDIDRGHLLIKDYLPTKFEASVAKLSWVISCTRCGRLTLPLTLTFDLLTWISIGIMYSSRTIYLPSMKLLGQSVLELSFAQGEVDWYDLWPWTYWPEYQ